MLHPPPTSTSHAQSRGGTNVVEVFEDGGGELPEGAPEGADEVERGPEAEELGEAALGGGGGGTRAPGLRADAHQLLHVRQTPHQLPQGGQLLATEICSSPKLQRSMTMPLGAPRGLLRPPGAPRCPPSCRRAGGKV